MHTTAHNLATASLLALAAVLTSARPALAGDKPPVKIEFKGWFSNPVFSANGKTLVYAQMEALPFGARTAPTQVVFRHVAAGEEARRIAGPADDSLLGPIALSPDGKRLAIGLWNTAVRIMELDKGKELARAEGSQGAQHLRFAPDGRAVGWIREGDIRIVDADSAKELHRIAKDADGPATTLAFIDGGKNVIARYVQTKIVGTGKNPTLEHQVSYWALDAASGKKLRQIGQTVTATRKRLDGPPSSSLFVSADGKTAALAGERGVIQMCDAASGKQDKEMPVPWKSPADDPIRKLAFSGKLEVAAATTQKGVVAVWDVAAGKELQRIETGQSLDHVVLSPDAKTLAVTHQTPGRVGAVLLIYAR